MDVPRWLRNFLLPGANPELPSRPERREEARSRPRAKGQRFWTRRDRHEQPQHGGEDSSIHSRGW